MRHFVLNLSCTDSPGIVAAVAGALYEHKMNISESHQFGDTDTGQFFMRVAFHPHRNPRKGVGAFTRAFRKTAETFSMQWTIFDTARRPRVLILVSKFDHCLEDLLYRHKIGSLDMEIAGVISNHDMVKARVKSAKIPFFPVSADKTKAEARIAKVAQAKKVDLLILARYMQILSPEFVTKFPARIINIHHSFLPSFKGAVPYSRAYKRGVKMIGATAHFVTSDLDEGPIITQGTADIRHDMHVNDLIDVGRDVEKRVLAQAVRLYLDHRILLNGDKTVIF